MPDAKKPEKPITVIKNASQAYGYKYSTLADIANAGVPIPKMRLKPTEFGEYIEYLDDKGEWQTGAKIVVPEMKGCNAAQAYGSALTYARRYTVQMAQSLACDDDAALEKQPPKAKQGQAKFNPPQQQPASQPALSKADEVQCVKVRSQLPLKKTVDELNAYWKELDLSQACKLALKPFFAKRKEEINGAQ